VDIALSKFEALLLRLHDSDEIFTQVDKIILDSCIEIKSMPSRGFLAYYCEEKGQRQPAITTSLFGVDAKQAAAYQWIANDDATQGDNSRVEPFLIFDRD
jgi:hypothetical protein